MADIKSNNSNISVNFRWKLIDQFSSAISIFVLQMILARILGPELYGILALMIIFVNIANVFIQNAFSISLVQRKDLKEEDYSSVFWIVICTSLIFFIVLFSFAPLIAIYFDVPELIIPFRVLILILFLMIHH